MLSVAAVSCTSENKALSLTTDIQNKSRNIEADRQIAFDAALSTFKNLGYEINSADPETGWITVSNTPKKHVDWLVTGSKYTTRDHAKIFIEAISPVASRIEITFMTDTEHHSWYKQKPILNQIIEKNDIYREALDEIENSVNAVEKNSTSQ